MVSELMIDLKMLGAAKAPKGLAERVLLQAGLVDSYARFKTVLGDVYVAWNRHDAEEVAQDTFLRAYKALLTYPPQRVRELKQRAWLNRIALNVVRNRVRGQRPRLVELNGSETRLASR